MAVQKETSFPAALFLHLPHAVQKTGLSALVESRLKPAEMHQLRLLGERLFDDLAASLTAIAGKPAKNSHLKQEPQNWADLCAPAKPHHLTVLGFGDEPAIILRMELPLACALVRAALGGDVADLAAAGAAAPITLTAIESRILTHTVPEVLLAAVGRVLNDVFANRQGLRVLFSSQGAATSIENLKGTDQLIATSVECALAGVSATLAFAIPLATAIQVRGRLVPARPEGRRARPDSGKTRKALAAAQMELRAVLGTTALSLGEVRALGPGSIILLQRLGEELPRVTMQCGERTLFSGTVVEDGGWYRFLVRPILEMGEHDGDRNRTQQN